MTGGVITRNVAIREKISEPSSIKPSTSGASNNSVYEEYDDVYEQYGKDSEMKKDDNSKKHKHDYEYEEYKHSYIPEKEQTHNQSCFSFLIANKWWIIIIVILLVIGGLTTGISVHFTSVATTNSTTVTEVPINDSEVTEIQSQKAVLMLSPKSPRVISSHGR